MSGKNSLQNFLARVVNSYKERFVISHTIQPYLPPTVEEHRRGEVKTGLKPFRERPTLEPSPPVTPELVYETRTSKRDQVKISPIPGFCAAEYAEMMDSYPMTGQDHLPKPWWFLDDEAIKRWRKVYLETDGIAMFGVPMNNHDCRVYKNIGWNPPLHAQNPEVNITCEPVPYKESEFDVKDRMKKEAAAANKA